MAESTGDKRKAHTIVTRSVRRKIVKDTISSVIDVSELLENILIFLDTGDIIHCLRVSKAFEAAVKASPQIKSMLQLHEFPRGSLLHENTINPFIKRALIAANNGIWRISKCYFSFLKGPRGYYNDDFRYEPDVVNILIDRPVTMQSTAVTTIHPGFLCDNIHICYPAQPAVINIWEPLIGVLEWKLAKQVGKCRLDTVGELVKRLEETEGWNNA